MRNNPETTGIASGVLVGGAVAAQVFVPEMALARLAGTARWLNMGRVAMIAGRTPSGVRVASRWLQADATFGRRAVTDATIQFGGGLMAHGGSWNEAYDEVNLTSAFMAGLPGDRLWHSVRNNTIGAAYEVKLNLKEGLVVAPIPLTRQGGLNFGQKVVLGVGADYAASALNRGIRPYQLNASSILSRSGDRHYQWLYRQRLMLLNTMEYGSKGINVTGEAMSNIAEDNINRLP